jgi:hypothetical protein
MTMLDSLVTGEIVSLEPGRFVAFYAYQFTLSATKASAKR